MSKVYIIAEAGVNHNGDIALAKKLVDVAAEAGADAVKFQTFHAENLASKHAGKASYQLETTDSNESQVEMLKKLELTEEMHIELIQYCKEKAIQFLSTPFDLVSLNYLNTLNLPIIKIPSGEVTNLPYLRAVGKTGKNVILSTGMSNIDEIRRAIKILRENGAKSVTILHCNTQYPTPMEDVNLNAMKTMAEELGVLVGYSDHTLGIEVPIAAVALGASVIEKHFTLDRDMEGPDHKASLEPDELNQMIKSIRNIEKALGSSKKEVTTSEKENRLLVRKSIMAAAPIVKGELFTEYNLTVKRPGTGLSPMKWDEVIGQRASKDYEVDEMIEV